MMLTPPVPSSLVDRLEPAPRDLTALNTLGLVSRAQAFVTLTDLSQLEALSHLAEHYSGLFVLGGGSNVILPEQVGGLVVSVALTDMRLIAAKPEAWIVQVGAGVHWHPFVAACVEHGWDGLENLALIPGTVGAAPVQNIGAYGVELADYFLGLTAWDVYARRLVEMSLLDCGYGYRDSIFKRSEPGRWIILNVRFALPRPWRPVLDYPDLQLHPELAKGTPTARTIFNAVCEIRRSKLPDPNVTGNAGSFFKNPVVEAVQRHDLLTRFPGLVSYALPDGRYKLAAGWLIEQCGWKGRQIGAVAVHDRQALVLVNRGGATARDIMELACAIQTDVANRYGVQLEREPVLVET